MSADITDKRWTDEPQPVNDYRLEPGQMFEVQGVTEPGLVVEFEVLKPFDFAKEAKEAGVDLSEVEALKGDIVERLLDPMLAKGLIRRITPLPH